METLRHEIELELNKHDSSNEDIEQIIDSKTKTEIQLNFLINQLIHYLSIIKK